MISVSIMLGLLTLVAGVAAASLLRLLPTLRLQLVGLALLAVVLPLGTVFISGAVMFHMQDDVRILALSTGAALAAIVGSLLLAGWILKSLDRLRFASLRVAAGDLSARAPERGPTELADLGTTFNRMATAIEELFDARRDLVAWASHDLRTPLASMQAMLEALEDGLATPDQYVPALRDQVRRLTTLVDDLFELARIDSGASTLELQEIRLELLVAAVVDAVRAEAAAKRIRITTNFPEALEHVWCAPEKIERVLANLLSNALRHTPADGSIQVAVTAAEETVVVAVSDSGHGLDPGSETRMFERFWRGDMSRRSDGAGLGLAIAQGLIEAQGGRIWAENIPERGARISFELPSRRRAAMSSTPDDAPARIDVIRRFRLSTRERPSHPGDSDPSTVPFVALAGRNAPPTPVRDEARA